MTFFMWDTEISFNKRFDGNYFSKYVFIKTFRLRHWGIMRSWRFCPMQCWRRIWWVTWLIWIWDVSARCCALSRPQSCCNATARSKMEIKTKRYEAEKFLSQQHHLLCRRTSCSAALHVNSHHWPFFGHHSGPNKVTNGIAFLIVYSEVKNR